MDLRTSGGPLDGRSSPKMKTLKPNSLSYDGAIAMLPTLAANGLAKIAPFWSGRGRKRRSVRGRTNALGRQLRLESLEQRSLLSVSLGPQNGPSSQGSGGDGIVQGAPTAGDGNTLYRSFQTSLPILDSAWYSVGYDIDARSLPANAVVTNVVVHDTVTHPRIGDLRVRLYNDAGKQWTIRNNTGGSTANYNETVTDTTVFAGSSAAQRYHYRISDTVRNGMVGTLTGMEIWISYTIPGSGADLTVSSTHTGNFAQGQTGAIYTLVVTNSGTGATTGTVSLTDALPAGLTATAISGGGWTTTLSTLTATRSDALANGASYPPITVTVNVANNAAASVVNTATVSGGGETNTTNDTASDTTTITQLPDLTVVSAHSGNFVQGQIGATYTLTATNTGYAATNGMVTVTDVVPTGLTATAASGSGWTTTLNGNTLTATRSDSLANGGSYPSITLTVNVANNAPSGVVNSVSVAGGGETNTGNDRASDTTTIGQLPDLIVASTHTGNFYQGQIGATYTLTVSNSGFGPTTGMVTLVDTLPAGLTATAAGGTGWTTTLNGNTLTATRSDALAKNASYAPITLTINVAADAPGSVVNTVQVAGGGETNIANDSATDPTTITPIAATPQIVGTDLSVRNARDGQTIVVRYQISSGAAASLSLTCTLVGPAGETIQDAANAGTITIAPGTAWYTRNFLIDLPPKASIGAYDVTWTIHSDATGDVSVTQPHFLTIQTPVSVRVPVLMYHNLATVSTDYYTTSTAGFKADMLALKAYGYTAVSSQDVLDYRAGVKTAPAKPIMITFDDGFESVLTLALPIISDPAINFKVTAFVVPNWVRPDNVQGGHPTDALSWSEIRTLDASGFVDVESHTIDHADLTTLSPAALAAELVNSKNTIEQQLNLNKQSTDPQKHVTALAYPYGTYNDAVEMAIWRAGYTVALQVGDLVEMTSADKFAIERVQITQQTSVQLDSSGWYEFLFNKIQESSLQIPDISITGMQFLNPADRTPLDIAKIKAGQSVLIHVNVYNAAAPAPVIASLALDSDADRSSAIYNSHTTTPATQDIVRTCPWGASSFEWTWTVPAGAPTGQYYSLVTFNDPKYVLGFMSSQWQTAFQVVAQAPPVLAASSGVGGGGTSGNGSPASPANDESLPAAAIRRPSTPASPAAMAGQALAQATSVTLRPAPATTSASAHDLALMDIVRSWLAVV
jgi:uncharacterized repeat protein (TIGR01451 family)